MIYKMAGQVANGGVVYLYKSTEPGQYADGEQVRDFIYVKDAVRMTCSFLDNHLFGIFNIGRGEKGTWNQLAKALFRAMKKEIRICYIETPQPLVKQYQNFTLADMKKFPSGYSCATLEDAVSDYVPYITRQERW